MSPLTLEQAQATDFEQRDGNRRVGVVEYESGEKQSDRVFEVTDGLKYLPGGKVLGPGNRFHPTVRQVESGSLRGKARELSQSEYGSVSREDRKARSRGADIGIRALPMAETTMKLALGAQLTESDFEGVEPGYEGRYTRSQVQEIIDARDGSGSPEAA
jgi:hypothetical protein